MVDASAFKTLWHRVGKRHRCAQGQRNRNLGQGPPCDDVLEFICGPVNMSFKLICAYYLPPPALTTTPLFHIARYLGCKQEAKLWSHSRPYIFSGQVILPFPVYILAVLSIAHAPVNFTLLYTPFLHSGQMCSCDCLLISHLRS